MRCLLSELRPGMARPWAIAHRGASATHPENTAPAFDEAIASGCDGIELDVQLSADGVPMVYHDRTLRKLGQGRARVRDRDLAALERLDAGSWFHRRFRGQRLLTLDRAIRDYGGRVRLLVEIKVRDRDRADGHHLAVAAAVAGLLRRGTVPAGLTVLSFDPDTLAEVRRRSRRLRTALNLRAPERLAGSLRRTVESVQAVSVDRRTLTPGFVRSCHRLGKPVLVFTCNTLAAVRKALDCGVDGVMSDRPHWLRSILSRELASR